MGMRMPNGYGSIIKMSGKRRKPYAVRITTGFSYVNDRARQNYKYLEFFEKRADAVRYLAAYNAGIKVKEHQCIVDIPTFAEIYELAVEEKKRSRKGMTDGLRRSYSAAFNKFSAVHDMKICNVRYADVQAIIDENSHMSESTIHNMLSVCHLVAAYAKKYEYITADFSEHMTGNYREQSQIHKPFTAAEIDRLKHDVTEEAARFALITIYTGMRPSELLTASITEFDMSRHYLIGGMKTDAGKDRVIPLHPYAESLLRQYGPFRKRSLQSFRKNTWKPYMESVGMEHLPHDGRHTCATLMESAGVPLNRRKLILGHAIQDITEGTYTHVSPKELIEEIKKLP